MIETVQDSAGLESLAAEWNALAAGAHVCCSHAWCTAAWECVQGREKGCRLRVLRWTREGTDEAAIFPFFVDGSGTLRLLGDSFSDAGDALCRGATCRYWMFKEASDAVRDMPDVRRIHLMKLSGRSPLLDFWSAFWPTCVVYKAPPRTFVDVPRSDDAISALPGLKSKNRARLKALHREVSGMPFRVLSRACGDEFPSGLVERLRATMVASGRRRGDFLADDMTAFARRLFDEGVCEIPVLGDDDGSQALAFQMVGSDDGAASSLSWINLDSDPKLLTGLYLRYIEEKSRVAGLRFDFGTGAYAYKLNTFRPEARANYTFRASKSIFGRLADRLRLLARHRWVGSGRNRE